MPPIPRILSLDSRRLITHNAHTLSAIWLDMKPEASSTRSAFTLVNILRNSHKGLCTYWWSFPRPNKKSHLPPLSFISLALACIQNLPDFFAKIYPHVYIIKPICQRRTPALTSAPVPCQLITGTTTQASSSPLYIYALYIFVLYR